MPDVTALPSFPLRKEYWNRCPQIASGEDPFLAHFRNTLAQRLCSDGGGGGGGDDGDSYGGGGGGDCGSSSGVGI